MLEISGLKIKLKSLTVEIPHLKVNRGDYLALMGTSGAGKTVLIEAIAGFHKIDTGQIILNGQRIDNLPPNKRGIAVVYQDYMLFPHLSVRDNILYPARLKRCVNEDSFSELVKLLHIENLLNRSVRRLSGGELQRVAIARALMMNPSILLLDEPLSSLDRQSRESMRKLIKDVVKELKATVIHITHDMETAWSLANRVAVMHDGKLLQVGTTDEILANPNNKVVADFFDSNILRGRVVGKDGKLTIVKVGEEHIKISAKAEGEALLSIRPESIILSKESLNSSMQNSLKGVIVNMENRGLVVRITMQFGGFSLISVLTPNALEALSLHRGDEVLAHFKASSVRVL